MVGKNIKKIRTELNMTQEELAEKISVTRQAISNWETEKTQPDIETLERISEVLGVTIEELIYGKQKSSQGTLEKGKDVMVNLTKGSTKSGIGFGAALAIVISYVKWQSVGWAIFHGLLNWVYVVYFLIKY
ncbi:MAG: helix-turn-helix domain-containing protein [Clostridia bacterium]|nr:helix-turn-helix domain-containing protein [Clostridia bacterium]